MRPRGNWCRPDTALLNAALSNGNGAAILETARQRTRNEREIREQGSRERPSRLAPKQLVGAVAEISCSNDTFVVIDAQTREGVKEA